MRLRSATLLIAGCFGCLYGVPAIAADQARISQALGRGAVFIRTSIDTYGEGQNALAALALLKTGMPPETPEIQKVVALIQKKIDPVKGYESADHHLTYYIASIDAVLLSDIDGERYKPELTAIQKYILEGQAAEGYWTYPGEVGRGDTSVTHYALLGLWACSRSGVPTPPEVWSKSIKWHLSTQNADGGFGYKPGQTIGYGGGNSTVNMTINGIGSMSIAWMHLSETPPSLSGDEPKEKEKKKEAPAPKNNLVLEAVPIAPTPAAATTRDTGGVPEGTLRSMKRAYGWLAPRYTPENQGPPYFGYYFYSLERMTALINISNVGTHDWYNESSEALLAKQKPDGGWGPGVDTPLIVLALAKSTAKLLKRAAPVATFGNGLLQGGRGLPTNLRDGDKPKENAKPTTPLDQMLASLSKASNLEVEEVQEQLVEKIQISDRRELIQQKELLVKLIQHPSAEIRRTAAWALGRTNDLSLARYLITALEDPDVDVNIEAHNALCWISRKPTGFDLQIDPFEGLPPDAGPDIRQATLKTWRGATLKAWGEWYLRNRPYKERGDEFEAKLREKLAALK